jgi:hypothetical protein
MTESPATTKPALREATAYARLQGRIAARREEEFGVHPAGVVLSPARIGAWFCEGNLGRHKHESRQAGGERQSFRSQFCLRHPTASSLQTRRWMAARKQAPDPNDASMNIA